MKRRFAIVFSVVIFGGGVLLLANMAREPISFSGDSAAIGGAGSALIRYLRLPFGPQVPRLGSLCSGKEQCNNFCKNNFGRCKTYCKKYPANALCKKPFPFEITAKAAPPKETPIALPLPTPPIVVPPPPKQITIAKSQQWVFDSMVQPVPEGASKTRLTSFPAPLDKLFITGPYGAHRGGHIEGLDHEWIEVQEGAPVGSWADGEVTKVFLNNPTEPDDWRIYIDYGDGLSGEHMDVKTPLVKIGDKVKAGQPVAYGISVVWLPGFHSGEFNLVDIHRMDGVRYRDGVNVSPFDYLRKDVQEQLIADYTKKFIEPYLAKGELFMGFAPWEPYLTNPMLFHTMYKGTLAGEWFLKSKKWAPDETSDAIIFLANNTRYYDKQRMTSSEDEGGGWLNGTWEADYGKKQFVMHTEEKGVYYGIFELNESGSRATLKIEYQTGSYPTVFSEKANVYIERDNVGRRQDGSNLGVRDTQF